MKSFSEVVTLAKQGNVIPLSLRLPSDLDTPVSVYLKLASGRKHTFLLESIEGGEKLARYSFIGFDPFLLVSATGTQLAVRQGNRRQQLTGSPIEFLRELFAVYRPVRDDALPRFSGGGVGYFAYDMIRLLERLPDRHEDSGPLPDMLFGLYDHLVVFDHLKQEMVLVANILHEGSRQELRRKYDRAVTQLARMKKRLQKPLRSTVPDEVTEKRVHCNISETEFRKMVSRAKRYIKEGDIFQVVLSRRWEVEAATSPLSIYRRLRRSNPSPYMYLLTFGQQAVIGSSPEMLVRVEHGNIETRPIAGTRPRGKTETEDNRLAEELAGDRKEIAEHTMLLDLGRNDIGRVSRPGTVEVREQMVIEKYSHVMHLVSSVVGKLRRGVTPLEGHFACFPAGTVSGAPKVRAMEIIDELEKDRRGVYAGSVAYLDFWGNLDSCITIRTVVGDGNKYYVQAGAGIVADSKPLRESRETEAKAAAMIEAVTGGNRR